MSFLDRLFSRPQQNVVDYTKYNQLDLAIQSFLGNDSTLTEDEVMTIPGVQASVELISAAVGQLPLKLYSPDKDGMPTSVDDYRLAIVNREANETLTGFSFKKKITRDFLLYGMSKTLIKYEGTTSNRIKALYPLDTNDIEIEVHSHNGYEQWGKVRLSNNSGSYTYSDDTLLSILKDTNNGITGTGVLHENSDILHLALAQIKYERALMDNGATPLAVLQTDGHLNDDQIDRLSKSWKNKNGGPDKAGKTVILENGLHFTPTSINPDKLQLDSSKKAVLSDIARMFNLPESLINSDANKYDSNEQNNLFFLQNCLSPILVAIESAFNKMLLLENEKVHGWEFKFDTAEILKTTVKEKIEATSTAFDHGLISFKEARKQLGYANLLKEDKDFVKLSLGSVLYHPDNDTMDIPNIGVQGEPGSAMQVGGGSKPKTDVPYNQTKEMQSQEHLSGSDKNGA